MMQQQGRNEEAWKGRLQKMRLEMDALRSERDALAQVVQQQQPPPHPFQQQGPPQQWQQQKQNQHPPPQGPQQWQSWTAAAPPAPHSTGRTPIYAISAARRA